MDFMDFMDFVGVRVFVALSLDGYIENIRVKELNCHELRRGFVCLLTPENL